MPYLNNLRYGEEPGYQYLTDVFHSVQFKDIVKRNKIRDVDLLERIVAYIVGNVGTTFSAASVSRCTDLLSACLIISLSMLFRWMSLI